MSPVQHPQLNLYNSVLNPIQCAMSSTQHDVPNATQFHTIPPSQCDVPSPSNAPGGLAAPMVASGLLCLTWEQAPCRVQGAGYRNRRVKSRRAQQTCLHSSALQREEVLEGWETHRDT